MQTGAPWTTGSRSTRRSASCMLRSGAAWVRITSGTVSSPVLRPRWMTDAMLMFCAPRMPLIRVNTPGLSTAMKRK